MTLNQVRKIIREVATTSTDPNVEQDPLFKFEVFLKVCDGLLSEHKITQEQYKRWVHSY